MRGKQLCLFGCLFVGLLLACAVWAEGTVGQLLEDALKSRDTGTVEEVSARFSAAADAATNPYQKSSINSLYSEYLQDKGEWEKVITLQQQILRQEDSQSQAGPLYNLALAHLELNQEDEARSACVKFQACPSATHLRKYVQHMKDCYPASTHARFANLLDTIPAAPQPEDLYLSFDAHEKAPSLPCQPGEPLEQRPTSSQPMTDSSADTGSTPATESIPAPPETPAQAPENDAKGVEVQLSAWRSDLDGHVHSSEMSLGLGSDVSTSRRTSPYLSVQFGLTHKDRIKVSYVDVSYTGTLNKTVIHHQKTYPAGSTFELETRFIDVEGFRQMKSPSKTSWGILYGAKISDSRLDVVHQLAGVRRAANWTSTLGIPYVGLAGTSPLGSHIGLNASIKWFSWGGNDGYDTHDLELKLLFGENLKLKARGTRWFGFVGYRDFRWSGPFDSTSVELHFSGPIFGLEIHF